MPTTLTGLILFVILLVPGFAYLVGSERFGVHHRFSPFRELVSIVMASITAEVVVLAVFLALSATSWTPDVVAFVDDPAAYTRAHPGEVGGWSVGMLLVAAAGAYVSTWPKVRDGMTWLRSHRSSSPPVAQRASAWYQLFNDLPKGDQVHVALLLDDGSYLDGYLGSFDVAAEDTPDRDLILDAPITYRPAGDTETHPWHASSVAVPARHMTVLAVTYLDPDAPDPETTVTPSPSEEGVSAAADASEGRPGGPDVAPSSAEA